MTETHPENLTQAAIAGDREALRALWHAHRRWAAAILLAHKPRESELDDLLQDVAMAVVAKIGGLRDPGAFKPWLRAVTLNVAKTAARRRPGKAAQVLRLIGLAREGAETESSPGDAATEEGHRLMQLAANLPDGYREPLLLRCVQGMGYRQIGEVMGLPDTTIETRIARGRRMLREMGAAAGLGDGPLPTPVVIDPQTTGSVS
jgi:RNA polymerase sigma-70 factor, ECF subfamily